MRLVADRGSALPVLGFFQNVANLIMASEAKYRTTPQNLLHLEAETQLFKVDPIRVCEVPSQARQAVEKLKYVL